MKSNSYLLARNGVWYFRFTKPNVAVNVRCALPIRGNSSETGVLKTLPCRLSNCSREFVYSLRTKELSEARLRRAPYLALAEDLVMKTKVLTDPTQIEMMWEEQFKRLNKEVPWAKRGLSFDAATLAKANEFGSLLKADDRLLEIRLSFKKLLKRQAFL